MVKIEREWEDLEGGIKYSGDYDPTRIRKSLGLDGGVAEKLTPTERSRMASMLWRTGRLTIREITEIGGWRISNPEYRGDEKGGIVFDPPPSSNIRLQE